MKIFGRPIKEHMAELFSSHSKSQWLLAAMIASMVLSSIVFFSSKLSVQPEPENLNLVELSVKSSDPAQGGQKSLSNGSTIPAGNYLLDLSIEKTTAGIGSVIEISTLRAPTNILKIYSIDGRQVNLEFSPEELRNQVRIERGGSTFKLIENQSWKSIQIGVGISTAQAFRPSVTVWKSSEYAAGLAFFERRGGLIFGAMLALGVFSFIVAVLNKDITFLIFSGWIVTTLRIVAINSGWDGYWVVGNSLQPQWVERALLAAMFLHGILTIELFKRVIGEPKSKLANAVLSTIGKAFWLMIIVAAAGRGLPLLKPYYIAALLGLAIMLVVSAARAIAGTDRKALLYLSSWIILFLGFGSHVLNAFGFVSKDLAFRLDFCAILSTLALGAALAERLRNARDNEILARKAAEKSYMEYRAAYDANPNALFTVSNLCEMSNLNNAAESIFDRNELGRILENFSNLQSAIRNTFDENKSLSNTLIEIVTPLSNEHNDLMRRFFSTTIALRSPLVAEVSMHDVTASHMRQRDLEYAANHDRLTGLLSLTGLKLYVEKEAEKPFESMSLANVNIDRFATINSTYGRNAGDSLLEEIAALIGAEFIDCFNSRMDADSFVIVNCSEQNSEEFFGLRLTEFVNKVRSTTFKTESHEINCTVSIGWLPSQSNVLSESLALAGIACKRAKERGGDRNINALEEKHLISKERQRRHFAREIRKEKLPKGLLAYAQPIVNLQDEEGESFEILLRMKGEDGSVLTPDIFLPVLEETGKILNVDMWMIENLLTFFTENPERLKKTNFMCVNLSGASLNSHSFTKRALELLSSDRTLASKLCLEVTEQIALSDTGTCNEFFTEARKLGARIALDDFGAGYTSFSYLRDFPVDLVKIDGALVQDLATEVKDRKIVRAIAALCKDLDLKCIAEWVEDDETTRIITELGIDFGQGWALGRPAPLEGLGDTISPVRSSHEANSKKIEM